MPWIREGECSQCGQCCLDEMFYKPMLDENGRCIYLTEDNKCQIRIDPTGVPQEHLDYWLKECIPYPDPSNPAHTPPVHSLPEGCGFRMVRVDG